MSDIKPWSTEDMVRNAPNWSLAGDIHLLQYLQSFSEDLLSKAEHTNENLKKLEGKLSNTNIQLDIIKTQFSSLHNTQFVESRVYNEDYSDSLAKEDETAENTSEEQKGGAVIDWKEAITNGIAVVKTYFDKVQVVDSDSEDETDFPSYVLRPKDPYADRPLPYIVGSDQWHKNWHVGLLDTSSESEDEFVLEDKLSDSDSDNLNTSNRIKDSGSSISPNVTSKFPVANSTFEDAINSTDLFGGSNDSEENNNSVPVQAPLSTNNFAQELARKLGHVIEQNPSIQEPEVNTRPIKTHATTKTIGNLFDDEPPPLNEDEDIFSSSFQKGLFSGGGGLFDDIPNDDIININKKSALPEDNNQKTNKVPKQKLPDLFSDDYDNFFTGIEKNTNQGSVSKPVAPQPKKASSNNDLFDDNESLDDNDLFKDILSNTYKKPYLPSKASNVLPYLDNEPPELNFPTAKSNVDKKPVGGVKVFGDTDFLGQRRLSDAKPSVHHSTTKPIDINSTTTTNTSKNIPILNKPSNLFDELHSGSINSQRVIETNDKESVKVLEPSNKEEVTSASKKPQSKTISLFGDIDDLFEDDLFSNASVKKFTSDLFSDQVISDSLFTQDNSNKKLSFHENLGFGSPAKGEQEVTKEAATTKKSENRVPSELPPLSQSVLNEKLCEEKQSSVVVAAATSRNVPPDESLPININLFDQNPPDLDDGWDSKSDNLFDDNENLFDSTSVVTGHRSGLFDEEPPSLFSESSGIVKDMSCTRIETDDSFNPFASSSRRFSTDIFNEQQSNDSFFVTKNRSAIENRSQAILDIIPESSNNTETESGSTNVSSLFGDNVIDSDLFSPSFLVNKSLLSKSDIENVGVIKSKSDDLFSSSTVNLSEHYEATDTKVLQVTDAEKSNSIFEDADSDDLFKTTSRNSLKSIFSANADMRNDSSVFQPKSESGIKVTRDDFSSKIGSPGKLKHTLNINVNALRPGSGIINKRDLQKEKSVEGEVLPQKVTDVKVSKEPEDVTDHISAKPKLAETAPVSEKESQILSNITKDRAKILVKRRPSTRKARQEAIRNSIADFRISTTSDNPIDAVVVPPLLDKETSKNLTVSNTDISLAKDVPESVSQPSLSVSSNLFDDPVDSVLEPSKTDSEFIDQKTLNPLQTNLFDESEVAENKRDDIVQPNKTNSEFVDKKTLNTLPTDLFDESKAAADILQPSNTDTEIITQKRLIASSNLFDDPEDFDDLFTSVKLPPKSNILKQSLFGDEDDDDDIFGNVSGSSAQVRNSAGSSRNEVKKTSKPMQVTKLKNTSVVEDPLSYFLE